MTKLSDITREAFGVSETTGAPNASKPTAHDRCDVRQCGAQAYVRVVLESGELLFCGHHATANEDALRASSAEFYDYRDLIGSGRLDVSA